MNKYILSCLVFFIASLIQLSNADQSGVYDTVGGYEPGGVSARVFLIKNSWNFGGAHPKEGYLYHFDYMKAMQKVNGGYLLRVDAPYSSSDFEFGDFAGNSVYDIVFLRTKENLAQEEYLPNFSAYCIGTYDYTTITGFERGIYAFSKTEPNNREWKSLQKKIRVDQELAKAEGYCKSGVSFIEAGEYDNAISDETKSIELYLAYPHANQGVFKGQKQGYAYCERGLAYYNKGEYAKAISDETKSITLFPDEINTYIIRSAANYKQGNYSEVWSDVHRIESIIRNVDMQRIYFQRIEALVGIDTRSDFLENLRRVSGREK